MLHATTDQARPQFGARATYRRPSRPIWLLLFWLLTALLAGCAAPGLSKSPASLAPVTPATSVPLAQIHWCKNAPVTSVQPDFPVLLPSTLSADYCLSNVMVIRTDFLISYTNSFYNNSFSLAEGVTTLPETPPGSQRCGPSLEPTINPKPSEPISHECLGVRSVGQERLSIQMSAPEAVEDLSTQWQSLQPNIAFLPS